MLFARNHRPFYFGINEVFANSDSTLPMIRPPAPLR